MSGEEKSMLTLIDIHKSFGPVQALKGISAEIKQGELVEQAVVVPIQLR